MSTRDPAIDAFFARCSGGHPPYEYQRAVAERLFGGAHLDVWAPTGAGKTLAVLAPFLWQFERGGKPRWDRLIYVLPLRSLVESIALESRTIVDRLGRSSDVDVRIQTGENPGDVFFSEGQIILTTYDQLLSGALEGPYGLPDMLHNINSAAVAGALVGFDEYHLMQPDQAFMTAVAHLNLYRPLCQSVWMTATATSPLRAMLADALGAESIDVADDELARMPAVSEVERRVVVRDGPLSAAAVLERHQSRSIALVNTVARANTLYDELVRLAPAERVVLLHSQFLPSDRQTIESQVRASFQQRSTERCILVCTQVIEAGMNISAEVLHTEAAPMSALVQRAGRCARFPGERGEVWVYPLPDDGGNPWLPYDQEDVENSLAALSDLSTPHLDPATMRQLVDAAHAATDRRQLHEGWFRRQTEVLDRTRNTVVLRQPATVSDLIRASDGQTIRVVIANEPGRLNPYAVEGFGLRRWGLAQLFGSTGRQIGWRWTPNDEHEWALLKGPGDLERAFAVCLHPGIARYTADGGLRLGQSGDFESPPRARPARQRSRPLHCETWERHAREVGNEATARVDSAGTVLLNGLSGEPWFLPATLIRDAARVAGLLHDVGKLQIGWQTWAERAQRSLVPAYVYARPLAHTDFNRENPDDRERERLVNQGGRRPAHAAASAWYSSAAVSALLGTAATSEMRAACLAAVLSHHGGWLPRSGNDDLGIQPLVSEANAALVEATGLDDLRPLAAPRTTLAARQFLERLLGIATGPDAWCDWWPIVAYLMRTLRLADQRATSLYGGEN